MPEPFSLRISRYAEKDIGGLTPRIQQQIDRRIGALRAMLDSGEWPQDAKPLRGLVNAYRVDSGEYRILYRLDAESREAVIFRVRHRRDVYRNL